MTIATDLSVFRQYAFHSVKRLSLDSVVRPAPGAVSVRVRLTDRAGLGRVCPNQLFQEDAMRRESMGTERPAITVARSTIERVGADAPCADLHLDQAQTNPYGGSLDGREQGPASALLPATLVHDHALQLAHAAALLNQGTAAHRHPFQPCDEKMNARCAQGIGTERPAAFDRVEGGRVGVRLLEEVQHFNLPRRFNADRQSGHAGALNRSR